MVAAVVMAAGVAVSAYSASKQAGAAKDAGKAGAAASANDVAERQREYDQSRTDQLPFLNAGYDALDRQNAFLNGDWSGFENSPDYKFRMDQGVKTLDRSAASHGRLMSGGYGEDLTTFAQGTAAQGANDYWNKLAGRAGQGMTTAQSLQGLGQSTANGMSNAFNNAALARQQSAYGQANAYTNAANQVGNWGAWYAGQNPGWGGI
jgi:hypothetical protein